MGVSANDRISGPYDCTGGETLIPYDFKISSAADLAVWRLRGGGEELLVINTDYTVSGVGADAGGNVTLLVAALAGDRYVAAGERPAVRTIDLSAERANKATALNSEFDSLQVQISELRTAQRRSLARSRFTGGEVDNQLPDTPGYVYVDSDKNITVVESAPGGGGAGIEIPVPIEQGGTGADTAPEARANLGLGALALKSQVSAGDLHPSIAVVLPKVGDIIESPDGVLRGGYLWCDGQAVSRTTYAALFARYGTRYGAGDGSTTFNLPDRNGRSPRGIDNGKGRDIGAAPIAITNVTNNGSGLIRITVASTANLSTGRTIHIAGVGGVTAANGTWLITVISSTTFDLQSSTFAGTYTSGGAVYQRVPNAAGGVFGDEPGTVEDDMLQVHTHKYGQPAGGQPAGGSASTYITSSFQTDTGVPTGRTGGETTSKNFSTRWMVLYDLQLAAAENLTLNAWHFSNGVPSSALGINGDVAVNTLTGDVYQKAAGAWGSPVSNIRGPSYGGTSATSLTIANGSKTFTTQAGLAYQVGALVRVASTASGEQSTHWMYGSVTAWNAATGVMTVDVVDNRGSGATRSAWSVNIAGQSGDVTPEATAAAAAAAASASAASASQTAAASSASSASSSASSASTSASTATTQASAASTSAANAASSASSASTSATSAASSATAASSSASAASTSATNAASSATNAASSATAAAASATAAAAAAAGLSATSTTSLAIGTGSKTFTTQSGKQFQAGQWLLAASAADVTNYMVFQVSSYSGSTLVGTVPAGGNFGSGTFADWVISFTGKVGPQGPAGSLDVGALSLVTVASDDKIVVGDTSNSNATAYTTPAALPISTATQSALDAKAPTASPTFTGSVTLPGDPASALQAVTKQYVDNLLAGLDPKASVKCATTANITLSGEQTIDGVTTSASRVLVKNQSTASQNGIYVSGDSAWTRAADADTLNELVGALVIVEEGSTLADTGWVCTVDSSGSLGSTSVPWVQFCGTGAFQARSDLLTAIAALSMVADRYIYGTGSNTVALGTLTSFIRTLLDDADAATARETLSAEPQGEIFGENLQTGTTYTFVLADKGKRVRANNASAQTYTVPPNSSVAFPVGSRIEVFQYGAGQVSIAAGAGVTIRSSGSKLKITGQYSAALLDKIATDEWLLVGDIAA